METTTTTTVYSSSENYDPNEIRTVERSDIRIIGDDDRSNAWSYDLIHRDHFYDVNDTDGFYHHGYLALGNSGQAVDSAETVTVSTKTVVETNEYLDKLAQNIYRPSSPQIVREVLTHVEDGSAGSHEQLVCIRFLQPPEAPPPGPLVIRELRPPQPAPPPLLVINEHPPLPEQPPPIILREEPPTPPPVIPSETVTKYLPPIPVPPQSVLIKRYPTLPARPPDILIERWLPYGPRPERETITYPAPPPIRYREPFYKIIQYEATHGSIRHRLEKLFHRENPEYYRSRYGSSLLDTATLIERARELGVYEDLTLPPASSFSGHVDFRGIHGHHAINRVIRHGYAPTQIDTLVRPYSHSNMLHGSTIGYEVSNGGRYLHGEHYLSSNSSRRRGLFDYYQYGLLPADYTPGMQIYRKFVRPANFSFPASSMWSPRTAKYKVQGVGDHTTSVTVELLDDDVSLHSRTITEQEYKNAKVTSSAPKLAWKDFLQVLRVFMLGKSQEQESDIKRAFDILDQGSRGLYDRTIRLSDGLISPDEIRAFLSILTDEYRVDLCVFLADTDGSGQISLPEFTRMVKSGLARDIICECI